MWLERRKEIAVCPVEGKTEGRRKAKRRVRFLGEREQVPILIFRL